MDVEAATATLEEPTNTASPATPSPTPAPTPLVRSWRAAPTRHLESGYTVRWCRVCKTWHPIGNFRSYTSGSYCALCRACEKSARRFRYLRDQSLECERARTWGRNKRAELKAAEAVAR